MDLDIRTTDGLAGMRYDIDLGLISLVDVIMAVTGKSRQDAGAALHSIRKSKSELAPQLVVPNHQFPGKGRQYTTPAGNWELCQKLVVHLVDRTTLVASESEKTKWRRRFGIPEPVLYTGIDIRNRVRGMSNIRFDPFLGRAALRDVVMVVTRMSVRSACRKMDRLNQQFKLELPKHRFPGERPETFVGDWNMCLTVVELVINRSEMLTTAMKIEWKDKFGLEHYNYNDDDDDDTDDDDDDIVMDNGGGGGCSSSSGGGDGVGSSRGGGVNRRDIRGTDGLVGIRYDETYGLGSLIDMAVNITGSSTDSASHSIREIEKQFQLKPETFRFPGAAWT